MKHALIPQRIKLFETMQAPLNLQAVVKESNRCLLCHDAPCSADCPAGTDPGKFIRQLKFYNYKGAARTIRGNNIMGSVCAFVCPVEKLCEKACSIKALEDPINISGLQRFAMEYAEKLSIEPMERSRKTKGKVAIVGAGPAGMGCAAALACLNYDVTILERSDRAGGVPQWNIPLFRLPNEAIARDVKNLLSMGVTIQYNSPVEAAGAVQQLLVSGFDAVFISTGLVEPFSLDLLKGFVNALDYISFLKQMKFGTVKQDLKHKTIAVIGGGSVAIDSAVSAKAAGARKVYLISLEQLDELPADSQEIKLAQIMHINFKAGSQITDVKSVGNLITGLHGVEVEWKKPGIFSPENAQAVEGTEFSICVDMVIQAIGTAPARGVQRLAGGLIMKGKGLLHVNDDFATAVPGVFAGGDLVNGGATVVQAIGQGKKAAIGIDNYLTSRRNNK